MMQKVSIRFYNDREVRAVWDEAAAKWWFCAADVAEALTKSKNPRVYWATVKRRKKSGRKNLNMTHHSRSLL